MVPLEWGYRRPARDSASGARADGARLLRRRYPQDPGRQYAARDASGGSGGEGKQVGVASAQVERSKSPNSLPCHKRHENPAQVEAAYPSRAPYSAPRRIPGGQSARHLDETGDAILMQNAGGDVRSIAARAMDGDAAVAWNFGNALLQMVERNIHAARRFIQRDATRIDHWTSCAT